MKNQRAEPTGFPRILVAIKWAIVVSLTLLALAAAAFWTLVLGGFAAAGFRASDPAGAAAAETLPITPECAWPHGVNDHDAKAVCRMYYHLTPEQRADVVRKRR